MTPRRKLLIIAGTRPEIIKQAPLFFAARQRPDWDCRICFTGQHREMGLQMFADLGARIDHDLALMRPDQRPADFLGAAIPAIGALLRDERPDWVAVQGDTTSALAGALAGFYNQTRVIHIEAGLRTYNRDLPFPEELHRQLITRLARAHAAPTHSAAEILFKEAVPAEWVLMSGNTGIDSLLRTVREQRSNGTIPAGIPGRLVDAAQVPPEFRWEKPLVLVTLHRRESIGEIMAGMCSAIRRLALQHTRATFVLPVHLNPAVRQTVLAQLSGLPNVLLIEPQNFTAFAWLLDHCAFTLTDSGGIQEEAPTLGKPVLVLRDVTERPEAIACGSAMLVGCAEEAIFSAASRLLNEKPLFSAMAAPRFPYGDGTASVRILDWLATQP